MKKIVLMMALLVSAVVSANAQIATENSKFADNTYITVQGGLATPLAMDAIFPLNPTVGIAVGKWLTPEYGVEIEGTTWLGSHVHGGTDARVNFNDLGNFNAFRGLYVGLNGLVNVTNMFKGYQGVPRTFETNAVVGIGWVHGFRPNMSDEYNNHLGAKTGLDFAFNVGKTKASTLSVRPAVLWNLSEPGTKVGSLAFNKLGAQLYLGVAYTYHFKNSNGTRYFKTYDVGAMLSEIARLNEENANLKNQPRGERVVEKVVEKTVVINNNGANQWVVPFAFASDELSEEAKFILNQIGNDMIVDVVGTASPEGTEEYNKKLSENRAKNVANYLTNRGVRVNSVVGKGVDKVTGKAAIVKPTH